MSLYDKPDDFPFRVQNYPHLYSNVPCMPMHGLYISQLVRFVHACDRYSDFLARQKRLVRTLLDQGFRYCLLYRRFKQFYRSHYSLIHRCSHSVTQHLRLDSVMAHQHSAVWRPIINSPFHCCLLRFSSFLSFVLI